MRDTLQRGKGVDALFDASAPSLRVVENADSKRVVELPVDSLRPNPRQPRREWDERALEELTLSVAETGVQDPIKVRPAVDGDHYYVITGHRRAEAARRAGREQG